MNKKRRFRRFFVCPDRGFHLLCLYPPKLPILCLPKKAQDTKLYSISRLPRYSSGQEPANPTYPNHNLLTFLFHSDPKTTLPPPSPISILAVPASLYLYIFPSYWHMPRLLSLLSILHFFSSGAGLAFPRHESFLAFFFSTAPGVLHCFLSSPYCPALYSPVAKVSLLLSFQRKKGPSLRGTPFPRFFFLISWPDR